MSTNKLTVWHPAYDAYHCAFRMLRLLSYRTDHAMSMELLHILDFYLLYPFLLHRASMPLAVRRTFLALDVQRDRDQFVQTPSSTSLFRDISVFQKAAAARLAAKRIIDRDAYLSGTARLRVEVVPDSLNSEVVRQNDDDAALMNFLVGRFGSIELAGARGLRALTGLVRRA